MNILTRALVAYRRPLFVFGCLMLVMSASMLVMGCGVPTFLTDLEAIIPVAGAAVTVASVANLLPKAEILAP